MNLEFCVLNNSTGEKEVCEASCRSLEIANYCLEKIIPECYTLLWVKAVE